MFVNQDQKYKDNLFVFRLVFTWAPSIKICRRNKQKAKVKIAHSGSHFCLLAMSHMHLVSRPLFWISHGVCTQSGLFEQLLVAHHVSSQFYTNCTWHISRSTYVCTYIHIYMFISTLIIATQLIMHVCLLLIKSQHTGNSKLIDWLMDW